MASRPLVTEREMSGPGLSPIEERFGLTEADRHGLPGLHRLNTIQMPVVRTVGLAALYVAAVLHNRVVLGETSPAALWLLGTVYIVYAGVSWAILYRFFTRSRKLHLGDVFRFADIAVFTVTVYLTGGTRSWLFFLLLIRTADHHATADLRRLLQFAHASVVCYALMLAYMQWADHATIDWAAEAVKLFALYLAGLYLCFTAGIPRDLHRSVVEARELIHRLEARTRELAAARAKNALLLNSAGEGIFGLDVDGRVTFINPAGARMLGCRVEDPIGQPVHEWIHGRPPGGTPLRPEASRILAACRTGVIQRVDAEAFWRTDGTSFPVEYVSTPIREGGTLAGAVVTFKDTTERRAVERMKDEFISVVSHELRTPLTSIRGSLGLLESELLGSLPARGRRVLEIARTNTDRLVRLVNEILDIERMGSGRAELRLEAVDAGELMAQAGELMAPLASEAEVALVVTPYSAAIRADADRIIRTLANLIGNAIKFSPPGSTVRLRAEPRAGDVVFRVEDGGRGIAADKLERIFERFVQVDASDSRERGGTGLGLAICRTIVEQHGGTIRAESVPGRGSTFSFTLPLVQQAGAVPGAGGSDPMDAREER